MPKTLQGRERLKSGQRVVTPPAPPPLPSKLPFEDQVDRLLTRLARAIEGSAFTQLTKRFEERLPLIESIEFPTPLGKVKTPRYEFPSFTPPQIDERRKEVIKAAVGDDISGLVEKIPVVGAVAGVVSDALEDTFMAKLIGTLTPEEYAYFREQDKVSPLTTVAALRTFIKFRR